jgi:hypothetical protein
MAKGEKAQAWWEKQQKRQGLVGRSPVVPGYADLSTWWAMPGRPKSMPPPAHEILRDQTDEQRGGPVPVSTTPDGSKGGRVSTRVASYGYDEGTRVLRVEWTDGGQAYNYYDVTRDEARSFDRVKSKGRWINNHLNAHIYGPA